MGGDRDAGGEAVPDEIMPLAPTYSAGGGHEHDDDDGEAHQPRHGRLGRPGFSERRRIEPAQVDGLDHQFRGDGEVHEGDDLNGGAEQDREDAEENVSILTEIGEPQPRCARQEQQLRDGKTREEPQHGGAAPAGPATELLGNDGVCDYGVAGALADWSVPVSRLMRRVAKRTLDWVSVSCSSTA